MNIALNENQQRVRPTLSGQRAFCPICGGMVIGKCGEIYTRHWQHAVVANCDAWKEHETYWHRKWKGRFPDAWQEIVMEQYGEKHIADIRTNTGVVIEFQNSSISTGTIRIRESFYGDMIWVINAESFKENFSIRSVVKTQLRSIEHSSSQKMLSLEKYTAEEINQLAEKITNTRHSCNLLASQVSYAVADKERLVKELEQVELLCEEIINGWKTDKHVWRHNLFSVLDAVNNAYRHAYVQVQKGISQQLKAIETNTTNRLRVEQLTTMVIEQQEYKLIPYNLITDDNYKHVRAILKSSLNSFFPTTIKMESTIEYKQYAYKQKEYDFAIDPTPSLAAIAKRIRQAEDIIKELHPSVAQITGQVRELVTRLLQEEIVKTDNRLMAARQNWEEENKKLDTLEARKNTTTQVLADELKKEKQQIEKENQQQKFGAMKKYKGTYTFSWKYERKSWRAANATLFFDTGDDYLFEKTGDGIFTKVAMDEFIKRFTLPAGTGFNTPY